MRRSRLFSALSACALLGLALGVAPNAEAKSRQIELASFPGSGLYTGVAGATYTGPNDLTGFTGNWYSWGGFRAYSAATVGTKSASVRCATAGTTNDINTTTAGDFDTTTLTSLCPSDTYFLHTSYDKTGNARDWTQATAANQPQILLSNCPGLTNTSRVCAKFVRTSTNWVQQGTLSPTQPLSLVAVAQSDLNAFQSAIAYPNNWKMSFSSSTNLQVQHCGTNLNLTIALNTWYAMITACDVASSALYANAASTTGAGGTLTLTSSALDVGRDDGPNALDGDEVEWGMLSVAATGTMQSTYHSNVSAYWGTP